MKTSVVAAWVIAAGALGAPACGSNGSDRCGEVQPCGGDVVGTWTWSRACPSAAAYTAQANGSCRGSVVNSISQDVGGTLTFNADLTFHFENATNTLATNNSFPIDCQAVATCAALDVLLSGPRWPDAARFGLGTRGVALAPHTQGSEEVAVETLR